MTHLTNYSNLFWCIDDLYPIEDNQHYVRGWIFSETNNIIKIIIGNEEYTQNDFNPEIREDVVSVYPNSSSELIGFNIIVPSDLLDSEINVVLSNGTLYRNIGKLRSWMVYNSGFNSNLVKDIIVVDNFYADPDLVRNYAINNLNFNNSDYHKGRRSDKPFILNGTLEKFQEILGREIYNWNHPNYANGRFQYCTSIDPIVFHVDSQNYAAMVYLTPNAPLQTGTATYKSVYTEQTKFEDFNSDQYNKTFKGLSNELNFYDKTSFEMVDNIANVYNRLVLFNSKNIHAAVNYFGDNIDNSRFFHLFFFDI
jgi:hypothetical protein